MDEEAMEIDDEPVANAQIIERKSLDGDAPVVEIDADEAAAAAAPQTEKATTTPTEDAGKKDDVVVLDDDDDDEVIIDLVGSRSCNTKCINYACASGKEMMEAPGLCLQFFRVRNTENKRREVCKQCYMMAMEHYDKLASALVKGDNVFSVEFPLRNDMFEIDDSDSENENEEEEGRDFDESCALFLDAELAKVLEETVNKYDLNKQVEEGVKSLMERSKPLGEDFQKVDEELRSLRKRLDSVHLNLYKQFPVKFKEQRAVDIVEDARGGVVLVQQDMKEKPGYRRVGSTSKVEPERRSLRNVSKNLNYAELDDDIMKQPAQKPDEFPPAVQPVDLPPNGPLIREPLVIGASYYASRLASRGSWVRVKLLDIIREERSSLSQQQTTRIMYKVRVEGKDFNHYFVPGKELAYMSPATVKLDVGTRVLARFDFVSSAPPKKGPKRASYYPGITGEPPYTANKYRYLVFFDDGYAQYVDHKHVFVTVESSFDVWQDINEQNRDFIKKYLQSYPNRSMVKLMKGQRVQVEYNGKWSICVVEEIDGSLVQVRFTRHNRLEWIYRGSSRLSPLYEEEKAAKDRMQNKSRATRSTTTNTNTIDSKPYVEYSRDDDVQIILPDDQPKQVAAMAMATPPPTRAVAKKSTSRQSLSQQKQLQQQQQQQQQQLQLQQQHHTNSVPFLPQVTPSNTGPSVGITAPPSKIVYYTPREQLNTKTLYKSHKCSAKCKDYITYTLNKLNGYNPLAKPLLCGWHRVTYKYKGKRQICYKAPCGRMIRNMDELHYYLMLTRSEMTVDLFDFEHWVRCLAEFVLEPNVPINKDLSNGVEQVPIPVVNYNDKERLNFAHYSNKRTPTEGVHLNLDPEFLCGCDCTDDCKDKNKCACWQLTLEGVRSMQKDVNPEYVGYTYRRLLEAVSTGIYECNSRCKCSATCLNRVVQNPLQLKLQVFKTTNRGWGIRCLNDIPQGAFICIYAGSLLTEQRANEGGMNDGDEYLAELDYIEIVEKMKEDYEEEAYKSDRDDEIDGKKPRLEARKVSEDEDEDELVRKPFGKKCTSKYTEDGDFVPPSLVVGSDSDIRTRLRRRNVAEEANAKESEEKKKEATVAEDETVTISDDDEREITSFNAQTEANLDDSYERKYQSVRKMYGEDETVYIMDAKTAGNIGRFLNHSCSPNVFVQNVFVDTHDVRFPWVAFFALQYIRAGTELTWNYNYDIGSVPGKVLYCYCLSTECKGRLL